MSNNYYDKYGRVHHKPVTEADPFPCNNAWVYSAYGAKAGIELNQEGLSYAFIECSIPFLKRNPGESKVPISRDEILGMSALGFLKPEHVNGWYFGPYTLPKFSLIKTVEQFLELRGQHRNYFWQNNLDQIYRFAFSVPVTDRHFILKKWGRFQFYNPVHLFYAAIGKLNSLYKPNGIDWLKYGGKRAEKEMVKEFPEDHPIRQKLGL